MKVIWAVARRELKALFDHPTGYILMVVFLAINDFLFFRQAYLLREASLRPMLDLLPWMFLFFVPAVTMRALAEDTRSGMLEIVLAQPITELELLLGKYLGQLLFILLALALTLPIPLGLSLGADLAVGVIVAQYVGAGLLAGGLAAVGVWTSSLTRNQITAFMVGVAVMFVLILVGLDPLIVGLPPALGTVAARLGVLSHFRNIGRGVIDLRDAVYFLTLIAIFLTLAYQALMSRKLTPKGGAIKRLRMGTALLVVTMLVVNLFGRHISGRLDLTPGKAYTLSDATRRLLSSLNDFVTIKLFASKELPPEIAPTKRDLDDVLRDFRSAGGGKLRLVESDPEDDEEAANEARSLGIPRVQFNVIGQSGLTVREGYLGLVVQYAEGSETIPLIQRTGDLEYRLASFIRSLTVTERSTVGLFTSARAGPDGLSFQLLRQQLSQTYDVRTVTLPSDSEPAQDIDVLVVAGNPDSLPEDQWNRLEAFLDRGGGLLVMAGGTGTSPQGPFAFPLPVVWNRLLEPYGSAIRSDMVYDLVSNERVSIPRQFMRLLVRYPFWVRALSTRNSIVNEDLQTLLLPWPSSVDTAGAIPGSLTPLLVTSQAGGVESGQIFLDPTRDFATDSLVPRLLGVMINPLTADSAVDLRGRVVAVGNAEFASDGYVRSAPESVVFVQNAVDWLAEEPDLIAIRSKNRSPPKLVFSSDAKRDFAKYGNLAGMPALVIVAAALRLLRRRRLTNRVYQLGGGTKSS